ncbi:MAG: dTDP-4-dehydrorhamnose 3,5-epimerase family protein [Flavobacterium sp.]|uniref:dTDP-4-dehydrorhamnose 3,5-epimerase family protein n=1 Tax=Flavobacterium sp. TaxID=239 RepID=UPI003267330C
MNGLPQIIQGGQFKDERGKITFVNDFDLKAVRRCYSIEHSDTAIIRAWQGHKKEQKWFQVILGTFLVAVVCPDDWENPRLDLGVKTFVLKAVENQILYIPSGFANGFKALKPNSKMLVFSDFTVEESSNDNFRFDSKFWFDWNI